MNKNHSAAAAHIRSKIVAKPFPARSDGEAPVPLSSFVFGLLIFLLLAWLDAPSAHAQPPPGLQWLASVGARLFAVDSQTNSYANTGGTVITLNPSGVPFQTNAICPLSGRALRDGTGNYLFAGSFDGTQNFGGVTLVGGWTNFPGSGHWTPGYPTCFLAKYADNGSLQWVTSYGSQARSNYVHDVVFNADGSIVVGFTSAGGASIAQFSPAGSNQWIRLWDVLLYGGFDALCVAGSNGTNGTLLEYRFLSNQKGYKLGWTFDSAGPVSGFGGRQPWTYWSSPLSFYGKAIPAASGGVYVAGLAETTLQPVLKKFLTDAQDTVLWSQPIGNVEQWLLAADSNLNLYLSGTDGIFSKYDSEGVPFWSTNYGVPAVGMVIDAQGNRFLAFTDGAVARLQNDGAPLPPTILTPPQSQTVFVGDAVKLSVTASGTPPRSYAWRFNGMNLPSATSTALNFSSVAVTQSGPYTVVVSNLAGSVTNSSPAILRVKQVELYLGNQLLTNGTYTFTSPPTLTVRSAFQNGAAYYTLDGSAPSFASMPYSGPFTLDHSATVRAIGYSADFFQSEEADTVTVNVLVEHTLTASSSPGGTVSLNPPGGTYVDTNVVTATVTPAPGWSFLYWLGDTPGTNSSVNIIMDRDKALYAVFGTTLSITVAGPGQVLLEPPGGLYPYGTVLRLTGVPQPGNYFGAWGNAASGNNNPLYFTLTNPNPTVSSIFAPTPSGQSALTVLINGHGQVAANPRANAYPSTQTISVTATPDAGQSFLGWSGDATGTANPLSVAMSSPRVITANFTAGPKLQADRPGLEGLTPDGFRFTVIGDRREWIIQASTNLSTWQSLGVATNLFDQVQFTDRAAARLPQRFYKAQSAE